MAQFTFFIKIIHRVQFRLIALATSSSEIWQGIYKSSDSSIQEARYYQNLVSETAINSVYIADLEQQISELNDYLFYVPEVGYKKIISKIISRSVEGGNLIIIDKGAVDGIDVGMGVVLEEGNFIGYVDEVNEQSAKIILATNTMSKIPATISGNNYTNGIVEGRDGFLLKMDFIPQSEVIKIGDSVITSGLGGNYPYGQVIGVISEVIKNESEPFQQALIEPLVDVRDHIYVVVLALDIE